MATYVTFRYIGIALGQKTGRWHVLSTESGDILGHVKWFGRWRRFAFFPEAETVFEQDCMRDIAEFIEARTKEHRAAKAA